MKTVGALELVQILEALERTGLDRARLCGAARIDSEQLADPESRFPRGIASTLFSEAERESSDSLIGLHAGAARRTRGSLAYLAMSEPKLRAGLEAVVQLAGHASETVRLELVEEAEYASLRFEVDEDLRDVAHSLEYLAVVATRNLSEMLAGGPRVSEVWLAHPPRGPASEYERVLGAPVRFRQEHCAIRFPASLLEQPIPTGNPLIAQALKDRMGGHTPGGAASFGGKVHDALERAVRREGDPGRERIASLLGVSPRTLQRHLEEEGTSFREIREGVLREAAAELLADPSLALAEIAGRLGYADAAAFGKAFQRWSGQTPGAFREGLQGDPDSAGRAPGDDPRR